MYTDYTFYSETYLGNVFEDEDEFNKYSRRATSIIKGYTLNRINPNNHIEEVDFAVCRIVDILKKKDDYFSNSNKIKSSETVGPHSVSYDTKNQIKTEQDFNNEISQAIEEELFTTGLLSCVIE